MDSEAAGNAILERLSKSDEIPSSEKFADEIGITSEQMDGAVKSLQGFGFITAKELKSQYWELTAEAISYCELGSPEVQVYNAVPPEGISMADLKGKMDAAIFKIGLAQAMKNGWVKADKLAVSRKATEVKDVVQQQLTSLAEHKVLDAETSKALQKRKLINQKVRKGYSLAKGPNYAPTRTKAATDLTREMLQKETWSEAKFKDYNFEALGQPTEGGYLHPLLKVRAKIMRIFLDMGFEEMPTNNFVESSFWNFDTLFQPQQHPARDSHDTFFLKSPASSSVAPEDYMLRVKSVHEEGGYGSAGYGYKWKLEEAEKNVLRTHTTAVSSRMLYKLAQDGFAPKRYFSIDRVFRNEAVDRTHLAEFHQIEGLICDRGLTLGDLIGVLNDFFIRLGITNLRFKPAYNPYTEPSMEIFSYHEQLKKWVEVGNSGMFRPEMLLPMGFPEDVSVIAWGLSLERPTMILYGIDNIRDLFGHKVDLKLIKSNPICRLGV